MGRSEWGCALFGPSRTYGFPWQTGSVSPHAYGYLRMRNADRYLGFSSTYPTESATTQGCGMKRSTRISLPTAMRAFAWISAGRGDSEGLPQDEYVKQEQDDGIEIVACLAAQPWCTGKVGMFGNSWSGFSSLQVAARRPPALKAIITHCSTDDRYSDGDQWMGGCIEETFFSWGIQATLIGARPPIGDRRRALARDVDGAAAQPRFSCRQLAVPSAPRRVLEARIRFRRLDQITCAVYAVGGWADHFNSTVARMLERLRCPRKGLIGPWNHAYPHLAALGPQSTGSPRHCAGGIIG